MANHLLTGDDLDALGHDALHGGDPQKVVAQLLSAVDKKRILEPDDYSYALSLASEITDAAGDLNGAITLAERAVAAGPDPFAQAHLAELLLRAGRDDEGLDLLTALRPGLLTDALAPSMLAEALEAGGRAELAVEWLTEALTSAIALESGLEEDDPELTRTTQVVYELATVRHRVRGELDLEMDEYDELAEELDDALDALHEPSPLVFWPQVDFELLTSTSAALASQWEPSWDEHRSLIEAALQGWWGGGHTDLLLLRGSAAGLAEFAMSRQLGDVDTDVEEAYLDHLLDSTDAHRIEWPPARNGTCWCGSGAKYKKCCLPRPRT
jgi:tetratricopeptide (TPR) repeat protein